MISLVSSLDILFRRREVFENILLGRERIAEPQGAVLPVVGDNSEGYVFHIETVEYLALLVEYEAYVVAQTLADAGVDHIGGFTGYEYYLQRPVTLVDALPQSVAALEAGGRARIDEAYVDESCGVGGCGNDVVVPAASFEVDARSAFIVGYALCITVDSDCGEQEYEQKSLH